MRGHIAGMTKVHRLLPVAVLGLAGCGAPTAPDPADCPVTTTEPAGPFGRAYGGPSGDEATALAVTPGGDLLLAGATRSFGARDTDAWMLKLGRAGEVLWEERFEGPLTESVAAVAGLRDGGAVVVTDWTESSLTSRTGSILVARLDCAGGVLWARSIVFVDGIGFAQAARETEDGGVIVAGTSASLEPGTDCVALKLSAAGDLEWQRSYGHAGVNESCRSIVPVAGGGYLLAGERRTDRSTDLWLLRVGARGDVEWQRSYGEPDVWENWPQVREAGDGTFLVSSVRDDGAALLAVDAQGAAIWQRNYRGPSGALSPAAAWTSPDGGSTVVGTTRAGSTSEDVWAARLGPLGDVVWSRRYPRETFDRGSAVAGLADGRVFLAGTLAWGSPQDEDDAWIVQPGPDGRIGGFGEDLPLAMTRANAVPLGTDAPTSVPRVTASSQDVRVRATQSTARPVP